MTSKNRAQRDICIMVPGDQLFDEVFLHGLVSQSAGLHTVAKRSIKIFMREDMGLINRFKIHKHKIVFTLAAMRHHAQALKDAGYDVHYETLAHASQITYAQSLMQFLKQRHITTLVSFEIADAFFSENIKHEIASLQADFPVTWHQHPTPMFLTHETMHQVAGSPPLRMTEFYIQQRKRMDILLTSKGQPQGGQWSFDNENRKALPTELDPPHPLVTTHASDAITAEVQTMVDAVFVDHPGDAKRFWLPVTRPGAKAWLKKFLHERLAMFGPYEDAIPCHSDFVFHSVLTPFLNTGLLTPREVVEEALSFSEQNEIPRASLEGFVRQIIGWREFIRIVDHRYGAQQAQLNFWNHTGKLTEAWWRGDTGVPPLDHAIQKIQRYGYAHHIERLMVIGSMMLLVGVHPQEAYRWFMEMFVDSAEWVMGPNVYGMALMSDGGIFATKPYICGSNYYLKMGKFTKGPWCDAVDGLYWSFIEDHEEFFKKNPRTSMILGTLHKMDPDRRRIIKKAALALKQRLCINPIYTSNG